jgi:glycolate oxidase FAD binding subunit
VSRAEPHAVAEAPPLEELRRRFEGVALDGAAVWRFAAAGSVPRVVVRPSSVDGVVDAVRSAREAGLAVVPAGNATHLDAGAPPRRYDVALSCAGLHDIVAHDAGDMTVTAQAGVAVGALNERLAGSGQWLPFDPPRAEETTLGGLIAADRNGPLRLAHGKVRDLLIGLRVVLADGSLVRGGGRVVKNVAGYDLPKLFTGSFGSLGVIVEATFKVRPRPREEALFAWPMPSIEAAAEAALGVLAAPLFPVLLEAVNAPSTEAMGLPPGAALLVGCAGSPAEVAEQERRLSVHSAGKAGRCEPGRAEAVSKAMRDFPQPAGDDALVARLSCLPASLGGVLGRIEAEAAARRLSIEIAAHAGSGVAWWQVVEAGPGQLALFAEWARVVARERCGWLVFESLPPALRGRVDPWGYAEPALALMARVKKALDPEATFSPGRFVGGL